MTASRRDLFLLAAMSAALAGCSPKRAKAVEDAKPAEPNAPKAVLTEAVIAEAEKVAGLAFTPGERAQMIDGLQDNLETLAKIRGVTFGNEEAPALVFNPRLPKRGVKSQKNVVTLGGAYDAEPGSEADIAFASVAQQGVWLRSGALTSRKLTELYLARIEKHNPALLAFALVAPELAREQATAADAEFAAGKDRGPLHGIPYALKDLADTAGVTTGWGAEPYKDRVPTADAEVVRKLKAAGAVLLGKTAVGAIAYGDRWYGGVTKNPWNVQEGSSGSSAGSASATAAGLCSFAIGTETLGSIISPAERCGVVGLRPTFGRISRAGFMALCWSLDKVGALCRSVEDTALVLSALNGYDADDAGSQRVGFAYDGKVDAKGMTVGYVPAWFEKGDDVDRGALDAMKSLGVSLKEFPWPEADYSALRAIVVIEAAAAFSELTFTNRDDELGWQDDNAWPNSWRQARFFPAADLVQIDRLRRRLMIELGAAFEGFDALIGPHYAGGALLATNCTGHPQLAIPAGFAQTASRTLTGGAQSDTAAETFRTPRAISLWGNIFQEGRIIALGRALEGALGVRAEHPPGY
jgi:Asp-tRNA(Asn)/Glu-tRNA(Gln) amidotransferase A subunit family amidase